MISWLCSYNNYNQTDILFQLNLYKLLLYMKMQTPCRLWSMCSYTRCKYCDVHVQHEYGLCGLVINLQYFISYFTIPLNVLRCVVNKAFISSYTVCFLSLCSAKTKVTRRSSLIQSHYVQT